MGYSIPNGGTTCKKRGKSGGNFLWGGGKDHSKPFSVAKSDMFSGKGMVSFPPLFLPQIFVGSPMYLETEGWKSRMAHGGPLEY